MPRKRLVRSLLVAVAAAVGLTTSAGLNASAAVDRTTADPAARPATVTLITGDRVVIGDTDRGPVTVLPGAGRERMSFLTQRVEGRTYVLPVDVLSLVGSGQVDRRLFDVTALMEFNYDDARRGDVPLIVQYGKATERTSARAQVSATGAAVRSEVAAARGLTVRVAKREAEKFWSTVTGSDAAPRTLAGAVDRIWLDGKRRLQLDQSVPQVGAPAAWAAGYTGAGVKVGILDTGVDAAHPDLADAVIVERNFTDAENADDNVGHGTHVASIITGSGAASGQLYRGVAPDVTLVSGKVCPDLWCEESALLAGLQWMAADQGVKIVNFSIGGQDTPQLDPVEEAVNTLTAQYGTLFVVSAGNDGPGPQTVNSPASADAALAVASVTKADEVAYDSSRGPRIGDNAIKPDIAAPGVDIVAAKARNSWIGEPVADSYLRLSGTSMAAPHVTGAAALLASRHPDWGPRLLKAALMSSAATLPGVDPFSVGAGRLDIAQAITGTVVVEPTTLSLGTQLWPHDDDQPVVRTLTYRNFGPSPLAMTIAADVRAPYDDPPPADMITVVPTSLTVPAGGSGTVTVTVRTGAETPVGLYTGRIQATTNDAPVAASLLAIEMESERYSVTLRHTDAAGNPAARYITQVLRNDSQYDRDIGEQPATVTLRLPRATYSLNSLIISETVWPGRLTVLAYPLLTVDRDITVDLDARLAKPVRFEVPDVTAAPVEVNVGVDGRLPWTDYSWQFSAEYRQDISSVHLGPRPAKDVYVGRIEAMLAQPDGSGGFAGSPYQYNLAWYTPGRLPTGFTGRARRADLATVNQTYLPASPGRAAQRVLHPYPTVNDWMASAYLSSDVFTPPTRITEYFLTGNVRWHQALYQWDETGMVAQLDSEPVTYKARRTYDVRWSGAVFGPTSLGNPVMRNANSMGSSVWMFSDGTPGHLGDGAYDTARTVLYRNGIRIAEEQSAGYVWTQTVPEASDYRLSVDVTRTSRSDVSTRIAAIWTFESGYTGASTVPITTPRFLPTLDDKNTAPAGQPFTIPMQVEGTIDGVRTLGVQVSFDDGATWQPVIVSQSRDGWRAAVTHPAEAGHVSLRAQATDGRGNTGQVTIIRAYHIG
jgi:subtilisin family serine protease